MLFIRTTKPFLHTRLGLGENVLKPYQETLSRRLRPNVLGKQVISIAKAKQAISNYRKAPLFQSAICIFLMAIPGFLCAQSIRLADPSTKEFNDPTYSVSFRFPASWTYGTQPAFFVSITGPPDKAQRSGTFPPPLNWRRPLG